MPDKQGRQTPEEKMAVYREAREAAEARGTRPTLAKIFAETAAAEAQAVAQKRHDEIARMSERDVWLSTLPAHERKRIASWEAINGMEHPLPGTWTTRDLRWTPPPDENA